MNENTPNDRVWEAKDRLIQQDRILVEARMLPTNRKLRKQEHDRVRADLRTLMEKDEKVTLGLIANQTSYASSTLSQWLSGTYKGKLDNVTHTVNLWIERHARRSRNKSRRQYVETWVCETIFAVVRFAHRRERMAAIVSPPGSGKDMVIDELCDELNGYKIECHKKTTARELLVDMAHTITIEGRKSGSAASLIRRIVKALKEQSCIIFLNEAQQLPGDAASVIRTIHDQTKVPIIMLGSFEIFEFVNDRSTGGGQFSRRCIKCNIESKMASEVDPDNPKGGSRKLYSREEIRNFIAMKQIRLADDVFEMLYALANVIEHGTLGLVNEIIEGVVDLYGDDVEMTRSQIIQSLYLLLEDEAGLVLGRAANVEAETTTPAAAAG